MKNIYFFFLSILLLFITSPLIAQQGWTIYNNTNTILNSGTYRSIAIDQSGHIWAGGLYTGLFEFTGTNWNKYTTSNSSILHDDIHAIVIDNSNKVWSANYKGISVFNGSTFTNYDTLNAGFNGMTVYALAKDNIGTIWISSRNGSFGYQGITTFDGNTWTNLTGYPSQILGDEFPDFTFTSSNVAWIASETGIVKYTGGAFTFYPQANTGLWSSSAIAIDASANIWAAGFDGLLKYNGSTWTFFDNVTKLGLGSNNLYYDIFPDGNILWIASYEGLLKFDRNTGTILANYNASNSPLPNNSVCQITKDANGKLWLATNIGIVKMDPDLVGIKEYNNTKFHMYPNPSEGIFNFSYESQAHLTYKIYSINGTLINEGETISNALTVNITDAPDGIYFMHVILNNSIYSVTKLVKK